MSRPSPATWDALVAAGPDALRAACDVPHPIVTVTPPGAGLARKPPLLMKPADVCGAERIGILWTPIADGAAGVRAP